MGGRRRAAKKCIDTPISPQECLDAADTILDLCCGGLPLLLGPYMIISAVIATRNTPAVYEWVSAKSARFDTIIEFKSLGDVGARRDLLWLGRYLSI
jgi:hypothetical protein